LSFVGKAPNVNRLRLNPRSADPANPTEGDLQYADGSVRPEGLWVYKDAAWERVNESTGSGINYAASLFDGLSLDGLNTYNDGASAVPTDGTGGSVTGLTTTLNSVTPLRGTSNQRFGKDAANRQGMGWSWDFVADRADYEGGKPIVVQFRYKTSASYANGDMRVFAYDKDAGTLLNVTSLTGDGSIAASSSTTLFTGTFSTNSANNDYRLIFHITSTNAAAYDFDFIDFQVGPDQVVPGAIITEWQSYTPTLTGFGTATAVSFHWRRNGSDLEVRGTATAGTPTAVEARLSFPAGLVASATLPTNASVAGVVARTASGVLSAYVLREQSVSYFTFGQQTVAQAAANKENGNAFVGTGERFNIAASVPISGWAASAALSTTETIFQNPANAPTAATASEFTPGGTDRWHGMTGNSLTLGPGVWELSGQTAFGAAASTQYNSESYIWAAANGANNNTTPASIATASGVTLLAGRVSPPNINQQVTDNMILSADSIVIRTTAASTTVYLVPYSAQTTSANARINLNLYARRSADFSIFSNYGQFQLLTATSSIKTPSATGQYHQLTGNSLTLTPGTWRLFGNAKATISGANANYTSTFVGWYGANGTDSSSEPAALSTVSGLTVLSVNERLSGTATSSVQDIYPNAPTQIVRCTTPCTVYLVTYADIGTPANARITTYANAERLQ